MRRYLVLTGSSLLALAAACGDDTGTGGSGGSGGSTGSSTSSGMTSTSGSTSSSSSTGSTTGASASTSTGMGGSSQGGAGQGGSGGSMGGSETLCADGVDDDNDNLTDCADPDCALAAVCGSLVINEIDYDQPGADSAEFVEIFNAGAGPVDLTGVDLVLVNGATLSVYDTIPLSGTLAAGGYLVVAGAGVTVNPQATVIALPASIQNAANAGVGSGDAVALYDGAEGVLIDALSYEMLVAGATIGGMSFDVFEGALCPDSDLDSAPSLSLARLPNGSDTNNNAVDFRGTTVVTPGAANVPAEICNNGIDDDGDNAVDCLDNDCAASPFCVEMTCDDGLDNDNDLATDCADNDCAMLPCGANGQICAASLCTCPGGLVETNCGDATDNDCDGQIDCGDSDCAATPACLMLSVSAVDYPVIAHGGRLLVSGAGFTGATALTIGGISEAFNVLSDTQIEIPAVGDATPIGANQPLVVTVIAAQSAPFNVTPIRLQISELDSDTPASDVLEFIEVSTGVPSISLAGYSLVLLNGSNDLSYAALELATTTDANGLILLGNAGVVPTPAIIFNDGLLQNGQDAAGIYQALPAAWPNSTPASATGLIDVVVYDTSDPDDPGLLALVLAGMQIDENVNVNSALDSIQRCGNGRRDLGRFVVTTPPTPGALFAGPPCP